MEADFISVEVNGPKGSRRVVIQKIFELCMAEDFLEDLQNKKGVTIRIQSSVVPEVEE